MTNTELLKQSRNLLLSLHKTLVDFERSVYEGMHGKTTSGQFLNLLIEDADFAWLRMFSTLIVDIDEMFAQKDGVENDTVESHLAKLRDLAEMKNQEQAFLNRYESALQRDPTATKKQEELRALLSK